MSRCETGLLDAEYALFDRSEVILSAASTGQGNQELGYLTTAGIARARLHQAFVTAGLANEAFVALRAGGHLRRLARSQAAVDVVDEIGPLEALEGGTFLTGARKYAGTWLDLAGLTEACPSPEASAVIQALHLVLVLEEVNEDAPVRLMTVGATLDSAAGQRTWRQVPLRSAQQLPSWLRSIPAGADFTKCPADEAEVREEILRHLKARFSASAIAQPRLIALASRFARTGTPPLGTPATSLHDELRKHSELLRGDARLRDVALFLSAMADQSASTPDRVMLAAKAWLAAGEHGHARYFARLLVDDASVDDDIRVAALEILESTSPTNQSNPPPPTKPIQPVPVIVISPSEPDRAAPVGASLPPIEPEAPPDTVPIPPAPRVPRTAPPPVRRTEIVETLALPEPLNEQTLPPGVPPRDRAQVRVAMIRMSRDLARDYRIWYGTTLKTNLFAIDAMQRHLRRKFLDPPSDERHARLLEAELLRHGALLSEILARDLGAEWVEADYASEPPGHWKMRVAQDLFVWPIGRVYRFFRQGHRESDLIAFYGELQARAAGSAGLH